MFGRKTRLENNGAPDLGMPESNLVDPDEGGPSPFAKELAQWRWTHTQQSIDLARSDYEPEAWHGGRMLFDLETTLAHAHQELRDRLQVWSHKQIEESTEDLFQDAGEVAICQTELEWADGEYLRTLSVWKAGFAEIEDEPQELVRLNNLRSRGAMLLKILILVIFVASEFIITGFIFNQALPLDIPFIGYVLAFGIMVMLIAVPHYLAQGIKEGITQHHRFDLEDESAGSTPDTIRKRRQIHRESKDDRGFKVASALVGAVLLGLIVPLSILRASETLTGNKVLWFFAFLFIQLAVSGYFFLREWLDHGPPSANLYRVERYLGRARKDREAAFAAYADALDDYFQDAAPAFKVLTDTLRLDAQIVESYHETLHFGRHLQTIERPDLAPFINGAFVPYLGTIDEIEDDRGDLFIPVTTSNRVLERGDARGRDWLLDQIDLSARSALAEIEGDGVEGSWRSRPASGALIDSMARQWLYGYLAEHFGLSRYTTPIFDMEHLDSRSLARYPSVAHRDD